MYIVTGAAGFIGSNIVADLEAAGLGPITVVDWFGRGDKWRNLAKRNIAAYVSPEGLLDYLRSIKVDVKAVIHMGAISATTEADVDRLIELNINYSVMLWDWCAEHGVPFIYASSAATYGGIEEGFDDDEAASARASLAPLNAYGWSKKTTDDIFIERVARGENAPPQWAGLKFFNVYGPNEYHKDDMRSVACKLFDVVQATNEVSLFKSYRPDIEHGEQRRDFVYVKDCTSFILWLLNNQKYSGIFNCGSGKARSFADIVHVMGDLLGKKLNINFIEMPEAIRGKYQYFTEANMSKVASIGYNGPQSSLEEGLDDYINSYLSREDRYR
ncbi:MULTISPECIES: ADP-glyceromanno-heptose 6-epimerase [Agrobacterium]|jgi:ADP-L-glycero-D-manno-heptose 6-epimerase|uniref:ADP-glyceromanno-heptose 6-epimerase n=1 Tax=Agrobacterium tumefaciens TaxID=358 RepID=UPI0004710DD4|nr:ADP-glyceromanno-heptose 6-epimerase [Agrobacterium tumefaciens]KAA3503521.1 ADP-glyceromanno-heptose 6-epimerase [Agrobacterium tumefaciens]MRH95336.1 ADP-glyceromanno-heptose 6-epimerase [Agrobacterium tumefaciens]NTA44964.1 ADP-glyceromanno-heptose 6-epimerase [Agrobacterium tumefaciens]NTA61407.1 ADP-glyceromanno-heptose 6-epimerase [Agrobacterium tumefaciens]OCJ59759.1 ADP-glyceromanno-heptose 6-epimerase [Agrobacterium tumefaciens]